MHTRGLVGGVQRTATRRFPLPDGTSLEVHVTANCPLADKQCYFTVAANRRDGADIVGFPGDLWARQTTTLRSSNRLNNLETQVVAANTRQYKELGKREITTIYFGGGPPERYEIHGQTQPTDWRTGQPHARPPITSSAPRSRWCTPA